MRFRCLGAVALAMICGMSVNVVAHHSLASQFDESKPLTLQGVITRVDWVNPHVYIYLDVKGESAPVTWELETLPPATLRRGGLRSDMLGKGQTVTVLAYQARRQGTMAFLRKITFADGKEIVVWVGDIQQVK